MDKLGEDIIPMIFTLLQERSAVFLEFQRVCIDEVEYFLRKFWRLRLVETFVHWLVDVFYPFVFPLYWNKIFPLVKKCEINR